MKKFACLAVLLAMALCLRSQDPEFFSPNQSLILLNPSFTGSNGLLRVQYSHRLQWPRLSTGDYTAMNSFDVYLKKIKAGIGLIGSTRDYMGGSIKSSLFGLTYAQYLKCPEGKLSIVPSVQFSHGQQTRDYSKSPFEGIGGIILGAAPDTVPFRSYFDLGTGLLVNYDDKFYGGISVKHLNQPDMGLFGPYNLPMLFTAHASYNMVVNDQTRLQFFGLFQRQRYFNRSQLSVNMLNFRHLVTGVGYSVNDAAIFNMGYRGNLFAVLVSYDMTVSRLAGTTAGSWEAHVSYNFRPKDKRKAVTSFESW